MCEINDPLPECRKFELQPQYIGNGNQNLNQAMWGHREFQSKFIEICPGVLEFTNTQAEKQTLAIYY